MRKCVTASVLRHECGQCSISRIRTWSGVKADHSGSGVEWRRLIDDNPLRTELVEPEKKVAWTQTVDCAYRVGVYRENVDWALERGSLAKHDSVCVTLFDAIVDLLKEANTHPVCIAWEAHE